MRFSVIIPTHNNASDLPRVLGSISRQTFTDYEVILVADACNETNQRITNMVVKTFEDKMKITYLTVNYHNAGMSRNAGLDIADGDYILFADDDDYFLHRWVFEEINSLVTRSDCDMALFGFIFGSLGYKAPFDNNGNAFGNVWSRCFKREAIGETRFPNVYPDDDLQFCNLMEQKDIKTAAFNSPIYYYNYMREGSISWKENLTYKNGGKKDVESVQP